MAIVLTKVLCSEIIPKLGQQKNKGVCLGWSLSVVLFFEMGVPIHFLTVFILIVAL